MHKSRYPHLVFPATRRVIQAEALNWLATNPASSGMSVITSLPDVSELQMSLDAWKLWFVEGARQIIRWLPEQGVAIFFQSDIRYQGTWLDKSYLINEAIEQELAHLMWHKIVCRKPPGAISAGRPSYSHMLCATRGERAAPIRPGPDVLADAGFMPWPRAMGVKACQVACRYLRDETLARTVVDPFCGQGSVLAVANAMGFGALGIDLSPRRCRLAAELDLSKELYSKGPYATKA